MVRSAISAVSAAALLCGCAPAGEETAGLPGSSWTIVAIGGQAPASAEDEGSGAPTIAFDTEGLVSGSTGCNRFFGGYTAGADGALTVGGEGAALGMTRMACIEPFDEQETRMMAALDEVARYSIAGGRLTLANAAGAPVIVAVPAPAEAPA
jgi:heat shock protein HslJ